MHSLPVSSATSICFALLVAGRHSKNVTAPHLAGVQLADVGPLWGKVWVLLSGTGWGGAHCDLEG